MSEMAPEQGQAAEGPVDDGQAFETSGAPEEGQGTEVEESPFFTYEHDDGEVYNFKSPDELKSHFRDGLLRHSDYTRKTQELANERKKFEQERERHNAEKTASLQAYSQWSKIDQKYKSDPAFRQALQEAYRKSQNGNGNLDSVIQQKLAPVEKKLSEWERQREKEQRKRQEQEEQEKAFSLLEKSIDGFERKAVQDELKRLQQLPPGESTRALFELLHYAMKGRVTPAEMEKQFAERQRRNSQARPPMSPSGASPRSQKTFKNFREAREAALKDTKQE
jgi:hypothetical protein